MAEGTAEEFLVIPVWKERKVENTMKQFCRAANTEMKKTICLDFYSIHLGIEVYEDGELIYNLKPVPGIFWHNTRGLSGIFLEIDPDCGQVIVRTHAAYERVGCHL